MLENHHCALTFAILSKKECNIFESLTAEQQKSLRKSIIAAIMCTDMANHCELAQVGATPVTRTCERMCGHGL